MASVVGEGSARPRETFSYTSRSGLEHFHLVICPFSDLEKAPKLSHYPPNTIFLLTAYYCDKINSFNIMALNDEQYDMFWLNEQILDIVGEIDLRLGRTPEIHEVVLAPNKNQFYRAVVLEVVDDVQAEVYFFDVGGFATVEIDRLKPVNVTITKFPILGHHVILEGVNTLSHEILLDQFQTQMEAISKNELTVEDIDNSPVALKNDKIKDLVPQRIVKIVVQLGGEKTSLCDIIGGIKRCVIDVYSRQLELDDERDTEIAERADLILRLSEEAKKEKYRSKHKEYLQTGRAHPDMHLDLSIPHPVPSVLINDVIHDYDDEDIYD